MAKIAVIVFTFVVLLCLSCNLVLSVWDGLLPQDNDSSSTSEGQNPAGAAESSPTPIPSPTPTPGLLYFETNEIIVDRGIEDVFVTKIYLDTGGQYLYSYDIILNYDQTYIDVLRDGGLPPVEAGVDGFLNVVKLNGTDKVRFVASMEDPEALGIGPGDRLHLLTVYWKVLADIQSITIIMSVNYLVDFTETSLRINMGAPLKVFITGTPPS